MCDTIGQGKHEPQGVDIPQANDTTWQAIKFDIIGYQYISGLWTDAWSV